MPVLYSSQSIRSNKTFYDCHTFLEIGDIRVRFHHLDRYHAHRLPAHDSCTGYNINRTEHCSVDIHFPNEMTHNFA